MDDSTKPPRGLLGAATAPVDAGYLQRLIKALKEQRAALYGRIDQIDMEILRLQDQFYSTPEGAAERKELMAQWLDGMLKND